MLEILQIPSLQDNYIYVLRDEATGSVAVIDPTEAAPVLDLLKSRGWKLGQIFNTHHHWDHVGGNLEIQRATGCEILASTFDAGRTPGLTRPLAPGDTIAVGESRGTILEMPGHTLGHIALWFADDKVLFPGDTLFSLGCGRLFEGSPGQMWETLERILALPDDTLVYSAHEYSLANAAFAVSLEPGNAALREYARRIQRAREAGRATLPFRLGDERKLSPFLRAHDPALKATLGLSTSGPVKVFTEVRRRKDVFKTTVSSLDFG